MTLSVFDFKDYRAFLKKEFAGKGAGRGKRANLANFLGCQTSFLSQVLTDRAHLSLEHAIKTSEFFQHSEEEKTYFMFLVQKAKAGSKSLESFFDTKILQIQKQRDQVRERIKIRTKLSAEDQMRYYSSWFYSAIHILCALPDFNTTEKISQKLKLDIGLIKEALGFLESKGFVQLSKGTYSIGAKRIHLSQGSPMLPRHHSNWRMKAIESVDQEKSSDLHYSAVLGIAKADVKVFKEKILKLLEELEPIVSDSKEEIPVVILMDLFQF